MIEKNHIWVFFFGTEKDYLLRTEPGRRMDSGGDSLEETQVPFFIPPGKGLSEADPTWTMKETEAHLLRFPKCLCPQGAGTDCSRIFEQYQQAEAADSLDF